MRVRVHEAVLFHFSVHFGTACYSDPTCVNFTLIVDTISDLNSVPECCANDGVSSYSVYGRPGCVTCRGMHARTYVIDIIHT